MEATDTIELTNPKFRVTIKQTIRKLLDLELGDFIEIKVRKIENLDHEHETGENKAVVTA